MNAHAQHDQAGAYGSDPSSMHAGGYGAPDTYLPDPTQHPAGANPYAPNPGYQQPPGHGFGGLQKPGSNQLDHIDGHDPSGKQGQEEEYRHEHENENEPEHEEEEHAANGHPPAKSKTADGKELTTAKKGQGSPAFAHDPHHHDLMKHYSKAAKHGVTVNHLQSFVHLGSLGLAMLSHHLGMTEGHEEEEEEGVVETKR